MIRDQGNSDLQLGCHRNAPSVRNFGTPYFLIEIRPMSDATPGHVRDGCPGCGTADALLASLTGDFVEVDCPTWGCYRDSGASQEIFELGRHQRVTGNFRRGPDGPCLDP